MKVSVLLASDTWEIALALFFVMMISLLVGLKIGQHFHKTSEKEGAILGSLFALLGLLLAFTFSMAINRYDYRRQVIVEEANDIGTAILRADLYHADDRQKFREDFHKYLEARILFFEAGTDLEKVVAAQKDASQISQHLWDRAALLSNDSSYRLASMQMIPALNTMIDITTTRWYSALAHVPETVVFLLFFLACSCAFYIGYSYGGTKMDWLHSIGFCILTCLVVLIIVDIDHPRRGFITLQQSNQAVVDLRQMFSEPADGAK